MLVGTFTVWKEIDFLLFQIETMLQFCDKIVVQCDNSSQEVVEIVKAFENNDTVYGIFNTKKDNFAERDEFGDRQRLLTKARELNADYVFHADADEIISLSCLEEIKKLVLSLEKKIYCFYKHDFWGNAWDYRLNGRIALPYIFPLISCGNFQRPAIPNFHSPRVPILIESIPKVIVENIHIHHYGYFTPSHIKNKELFYNINPNTTGNVWGRDMQLTTEEYRVEYGLGHKARK
jgi:hypothetical protein